jgi:hypothetical protein
MGVGFSLYGLAALYQYFSQDPIIKHTVKCRYCRKRINEKVSDGQHTCGRRLWLTREGCAMRQLLELAGWEGGSNQLSYEGEERPGD